MISIIICSRKPDITQSLKDNISETIGVEYELVVIDNSKNQYSIFQAYNKGVDKAHGDILCFMHEDILYHTQNWGEKVVAHFKDDSLGLIGVVGTHFLPDTPSGWYNSMVVSGGCIQRETANDENSAIEKRSLQKMDLSNSIEAVVVDGMWFCIKKGTFYKIHFDDLTFGGFHCYDLDISMQVLEIGLNVRIISDVLLEHFSYGSFDLEWLQSVELFYNKWMNKLPQIKGVEMSETEIEIRTEFVKQVMVWMKSNAFYKHEFQKIKKSKSYKIGKFLLKPLSFLK